MGSFTWDQPLKDVEGEEYCKENGQENCQRCFDADTTFNIGGSSLCYECVDKKGIFWVEGKCKEVTEVRSIIGWGRTCAACGQGNYWSTKVMSCLPCTYEAAYCINGNCCDENRDYNCTDTFSIDPKTERCSCSKGDLFKIYKKCNCVGQENVYITIEDDQSVKCNKCTDKCNKGCEKYECGTGYYLDGCECKKVHYSCLNGTGPSETECTVCKSPFEFVQLDLNNKVCLCPCCSHEANQACVDNTVMTAACGCNNTYFKRENGVCTPITIFWESMDKIINMVIGGKQRVNVVYRASRDGFTLNKFIEIGQGGTIIVMKTKSGKIYGGFRENGFWWKNNDHTRVFSISDDKLSSDSQTRPVLDANRGVGYSGSSTILLQLEARTYNVVIDYQGYGNAAVDPLEDVEVLNHFD